MLAQRSAIDKAVRRLPGKMGNALGINMHDFKAIPGGTFAVIIEILPEKIHKFSFLLFLIHKIG